MSIDIVKFPEDRRDWTEFVKQHSLGEASIHSTTCDSASKISTAQYLLLRSFWVIRSKIKSKDPKEWGIKRVNESEKWLNENKDWLAYLQNLSPITTYSAPPPRLGTFAYTWFTHQQVVSLPIKYDEGEAEDKNVSFSPIASRLRSSDKKAPPHEEEQSSSPLDKKTPSHGEERSSSPLDKKGYRTPPGQVTRSDGLFHHSDFDRAARDSTMEDLTRTFSHMKTGEESQKSPSQSLSSKSDATHKSDSTSNEHKYSPRSARRAFPKVEDEQIVNGFLIALLASICMYHNGVKLQWSPVRKGFKFGKKDAEEGNADKPYLFEARTDGHLASWNPGSKDVKPSAIIVEVKPTSREYNNRVIYQATAQMAAWIFQEPDPPGAKQPYRRPMIIQEREKIRLIIAKYDQRYVDYLHNKPSNGPAVALMEMYELYSWNITNESQMQKFGSILLALALQNGKLEY
ncbi:hypothetical protein McanMca71_007629 [Microsporum canis]